MRLLIAFPCAGDMLVGTLDAAIGGTGLLIVSGGTEIRVGAHRGMAMLAAALAAEGIPVFRYDRRGVGDSGGTDPGYRGARDDLVAAVAAFRREQPGLDRIVGFGNCDASAALALHGRDAGIDALVLANPWTIDGDDAFPPAAAIRARYAERLRNPASWRRGIDLRKAFGGLRRLVVAPREPGTVADLVIDAIRGWGNDARVVLADRDATAIAYVDAARQRRLRVATTTIPTASHSFARDGDAAALAAAIRAAL